MDCTTVFLAMSGVKSTINLSNSDTVKFLMLGHLEDSHKYSFMKMVEQFSVQVKIMSTPLHSL